MTTFTKIVLFCLTLFVFGIIFGVGFVTIKKPEGMPTSLALVVFMLILILESAIVINLLTFCCWIVNQLKKRKTQQDL